MWIWLSEVGGWTPCGVKEILSLLGTARNQNYLNKLAYNNPTEMTEASAGCEKIRRSLYTCTYNRTAMKNTLALGITAARLHPMDAPN